MDGLTQENEKTIREFLQFCLNDGFYAFEIEGKEFLLRTPEDLEKIAQAIQRAKPPVYRYRLGQAQRAMAEIRNRSSHSNIED